MPTYYFLAAYILGNAIWLIMSRNSKRARFTYVLATMGCLGVLAMFKSVDVGNDTRVYVNLFNSVVGSSDLLPLTRRYEVGYLYLNKFLSYISNGHQILFIVTGGFTFFVFGRFIYKYSHMAWLSVFLFFTLRYFDLSLSGIRQIMSIALVVLSYEYIIKRKPLRFTLAVILASLFHTSAFVFLIAYPISKAKLSRTMVTCSILAGVSGYLLFPTLMPRLLALFPRYRYYLGGSYLDGRARVGTLANFGVMLMILIVSEICNRRFCFLRTYTGMRRLKAISLKSQEDEVLSVLTLMACAFTFISFRGAILERLGTPFGIFSIIYLPNAVKKASRDRKGVFLLLIIVISFTYSTIIQIYRPAWQSSYPYTFFWN